METSRCLCPQVLDWIDWLIEESEGLINILNCLLSSSNHSWTICQDAVKKRSLPSGTMGGHGLLQSVWKDPWFSEQNIAYTSDCLYQLLLIVHPGLILVSHQTRPRYNLCLRHFSIRTQRTFLSSLSSGVPTFSSNDWQLACCVTALPSLISNAAQHPPQSCGFGANQGLVQSPTNFFCSLFFLIRKHHF